ncbi:MAG: hypothetical protein ABSG49_06820 [Methanoregula sp.]|jgi:hypothetical protein|uniref:hypothetical protein n=1 Tax=Methanoregula sp. TaxID=2052170 RepID=UPI003C24E61E
MGHSRLVTNGRCELNTNNQPVIKDGAVGIHNGIIVNDYLLWKAFPVLEKKFDVDTEVLLSLLQSFRTAGLSLTEAAKKTYGLIEGSASIAVTFDDINMVLLTSNTGSLYFCTSRKGDIIVFASEKFILKQLFKRHVGLFDPDTIEQIRPGTGCVIDLSDLKKTAFSLQDKGTDTFTGHRSPKLPISDISAEQGPLPDIDSNRFILTGEVKDRMLKTWEYIYSDRSSLRRCTRCLLPETMPFIHFDEEGVCNHCRQYENEKKPLKGEAALKEFVSQYRRSDGEPDVLIGFSGGRDSSYGLDYLKNKLNLNPLTFIYDWGMVTDLARRNQARVCGKLGIEQILVSADIRKKREYIHKNLEAWLKKPDLGMVPILMAGDKEFYYYFHKIRKENNIRLFVFCGGYEGEESSGLFKLGFCGVDRGKGSAEYRMTGISFINKLRLITYYLKSYLTNPAYINGSLFDTLFAFYSSYMLTDDYVYLYQYIPWDEKMIVSTIREKFDWEIETDTPATWRTDDGTAAIYNYIYFAIAGFTEFDGIRSHQIREGKLTRAEAMEIIKAENKPRFKSLEWYAETIEFDLNRAIDIINRTPKLYQ